LLGILIGLAVFIVSVMVVGFCASAYVKKYIRSDEFREKVAETASKSLKAQGGLETLTWEGSSAFTNRFQASGYEDAKFSKLEIAGLRTDLDLSMESFRRGVWKIERVDVSQLDLQFSDSERIAGTYADAHSRSADLDSDSGSSGGGGGGYFSRFIPDQTEMGPLNISNTNLYWKGESPIQATGVQSTITFPNGAGPVMIKAKGGAIRGEKISKIDVGHMDLSVSKGDVYINDSQFYLMDGAKLTLQGDVKQSNDDLLLKAELSDLKADKVLPPDWTSKISGVIGADATITGRPSNTSSIVYKGTAQMDKGVIEAIPALESLARYTSTERFRRVALSRASADFTHENGKTQIYNIAIQSDGLARLEGSLEVTNAGELSGVLQLGVIPNTLSWIPGAERKVFVDAREGHLWTTVNVGGTVEDPRHDLIQQLAAAGLETTKEQLQQMLEDPSKAQENANELLKTGVDLLNSFLK